MTSSATSRMPAWLSSLRENGFTPDAIRILSHAYERTLAHTAFGPVRAIMALWSLLRWEKTAGLTVLAECLGALDSLECELMRLICESPSQVFTSSSAVRTDLEILDLTSLVTLADDAARQAKAMGHLQVGTEHLVTALVNSSDEFLSDLFQRYHLNPGYVHQRAQVIVDSHTDVAWQIENALACHPSPHGPPFTDELVRLLKHITERAFARKLQEAPLSLSIWSLLRWERHLAAAAMETCGADLRKLEKELAAQLPNPVGLQQRASLDMRQIGHAVGSATEEARLLGHNYVGVEHIVLALCMGNDDVRVLLAKHGITHDHYLESLLRWLSFNR